MTQIRPVSDLRNRYPDVESQVMKSGEPVFLTKNGYGSMVLMSIEQYDALTGSIDRKLAEADAHAAADPRRYTDEEIFGSVREQRTSWMSAASSTACATGKK